MRTSKAAPELPVACDGSLRVGGGRAEASCVGDSPGILQWGPQKAISSTRSRQPPGFLTSGGSGSFLGCLGRV